jgi:HxlR-like helix-turn-helix
LAGRSGSKACSARSRDRREHPLRAPQAAGAGGLLIARPYSERPPRAAYQLTAEGTELAGALRLLAHWGARHADPAEAPRHHACDTHLEARWYCPTCDHLVDHEPRDAEVSYL